MWKFFKRLKPAAPATPHNPLLRQLRYQQLEPRYALSAATISNFMVAQQTGTTVLVTGYVADEDPSSVQVQIGGVVSGQVSVNAQGYFQLSQQASGLGQITAVAHDNENLDSTQYSTQLISNVPAITGLTVSQTSNGKQVTVSGTVSDEAPGNRTVTLTGVVSGSATTNSSGAFSVTLQATALGTVSASVADVWGQNSTAAMATLTSGVPLVAGLTVQETSNGRMVTISGTVSDESPSGRTVTLSGVVSGTATSGANGAFSTTLEASALGTVSATVTDVWGQTSQTATATLVSTAPSVTLNVVEAGGGKYVTLSGTVMDTSSAGRTVTFGGVVSGTATTNAQGNYSITLLASQLGQITAVTTDVWGQSSTVAQKTLTSNAPSISLSATEGQNEIWTFAGSVFDEKYYGLTVTFGGLLAGLSTTVGLTGMFSIAQTIGVGVTGTVTAQVTDWWGLASNVAQATVVNL